MGFLSKEELSDSTSQYNTLCFIPWNKQFQHLLESLLSVAACYFYLYLSQSQEANFTQDGVWGLEDTWLKQVWVIDDSLLISGVFFQKFKEDMLICLIM